VGGAVAWIMALAVGEPGADCGGQGVGVKPAERAADGGLSRHRPMVVGGVAPGAERGKDRLGASVAHSAMAAKERAPASTAAAARARIATSGWRRPARARGSGTAAR
jgi:hypothetical protein